MKRFRLIVVAALLLLGCMAGQGLAADAAQAVAFKTHAGFTRILFPADIPLDHALKVETSGEEKYLALTSDSPSLFTGFSSATIEDGVVQRLDMSESDGKKTIRIFLGPRYRTHRSFMVRQPGRLVVEVLGAAEPKGSPGPPVVVIDAGHGGADAGVVVPSGGKEKDLCLDIAVRLRKLLEKDGVKVVMTRNADYAVSDMERASIAHQHRGGLFLSIHVAPRPAAGGGGVRTFVQDWSVSEAWLDGSSAKAEVKPHLWGVQQVPHIYRSVALAAAIERAFVEKESSPRMAASLMPSPVLAALDMPAALAEVADSSEKAGSLASEKYRQKAAEKMAQGIRAAIKKTGEPGGTE